MKKFFLLCCLGFFTLPALAAAGSPAKYVGGTVPGMKIGVVGEIDVSGATLIFESPSHRISIPYSSIESFEQSTEVARHLGILPAIVVALIKPRQRRHFVGISYHEDLSTAQTQVVILEVPKDMTRTLQRVLETRTRRNAEMPKHPCSSGSQ